MICACKNQKYKLYFCTKTRFLKKHNINFNTNQNKQYLIFNKIVIMFECYFITLSIDFKTNHDNIPFFFYFNIQNMMLAIHLQNIIKWMLAIYFLVII